MKVYLTTDDFKNGVDIKVYGRFWDGSNFPIWRTIKIVREEGI